MPFVFLRSLTVSLWIDFLATNTNAIRATVQLCDHKHERPPENVSKMRNPSQFQNGEKF